jgi:hypothetical protein
MTASNQPLHDALHVEVECTGPLPENVKVYVVDQDTGYKSILEGVTGVSFYASMGSVNSVSLDVIARKVNLKGVLDKVEEPQPSRQLKVANESDTG